MILRPVPKMSEPKNKYRAKKTKIDGIQFDSKAEAYRYGYLKSLERDGSISGLKTQVKYLLVGKNKKDDGKMERECCYLADFVYQDIFGKTVVEDVKGQLRPTPLYILKRKLMLSVHGVTVKEIRK